MPDRPEIPAAHLEVVSLLSRRLEEPDLNWAFTGSIAHAFQGAPVPVHDIDIQTDERAAATAAELLAEFVEKPLRLRESARIRSLFAQLRINDIPVELMGALQKRRSDGSWETPVDPRSHRVFVDLGSLFAPVLDIAYEATAYRQLGRHDRADILEALVRTRDKSP